MTKMLLVLNGATYSSNAVKTALKLAKEKKAKLDLLYVNPTCHQMFPGVKPGLCFWMPDFEYNVYARRFKNKVMKEISPMFREKEMEPQILVTNREQDEAIRDLSNKKEYEKIFIASPSRYCSEKNKGWFNFKSKFQERPSGTVCLV